MANTCDERLIAPLPWFVCRFSSLFFVVVAAADLYRSDWNPQNDLQAQARCHRIGQTKSVKVYRLISRKTYEMQLFHTSSMKMGLDQAVLKGVEGGSSKEQALAKEEVERLLRHGAYDIFSEEKAGTAEAESKEFVEQDIDSILERRSRTVTHKNTGSQSNAAGGTFSKAIFSAPKSAGENKSQSQEDIDIEDPEFWKKMVGEAPAEVATVLKPRKRSKANYSERDYEKQFKARLDDGSDDSESSVDEYSSSDGENAPKDRKRWGGQQPLHWDRKEAEALVKCLDRYGYGVLPWNEYKKVIPPKLFRHPKEEVSDRVQFWVSLVGVLRVHVYVRSSYRCFLKLEHTRSSACRGL